MMAPPQKAMHVLFTACLAATTMLFASNAASIGLLQAYEAALSNDPVYQAARHENEAGQQNRAIGRASLLPTLSASYSASRNKLTDREYTPDGGSATPQDPVDYNSNVAAISMRQPIVNFDGIARYQQGAAQASYSDAVFSGRSQELIVRVVSAYAEAQYATDQVAFATAQRDAYVEQMKVNKRMFELGEATKTDMLETQAKAELAEAQLIEAQDNAVTALHTLAGIIGKEVKGLDTLANNFPIQPMRPASIDEWKILAMEKNAELLAQRHAVEAARQEVNKNRAGHFPRLDAVASYSDAKSETVNTYNQEYRARSIGIQLNIPLFSGGYTNAVTTQAAANHAKAKSELDAKTNQVMVELRKQYGLVTSGATRLRALERAVDAARLLISATEKSIQGGIRINLDLLNAQQQLYTAQRDQAQARYNYLLAYLKLRHAAGILNHDDLRIVASYYTPSASKEVVRFKENPKESPKSSSSGSTNMQTREPVKKDEEKLNLKESFPKPATTEIKAFSPKPSPAQPEKAEVLKQNATKAPPQPPTPGITTNRQKDNIKPSDSQALWRIYVPLPIGSDASVNTKTAPSPTR